MNKKISAAMLSFTMLAAPLSGFAAITADDIDYTEELRTLENLMSQCAEKGISCEYENVIYQTIERFDDYLVQDINDGVDDSITSYNVSAMNALYNEAAANLEAYIAGTKSPKEAELADMTKIAVSDTDMTADGMPAFSIGYGHSNDITDDIESFNGFGASNISMEFGPADLFDFSVPFEDENHSTSYEVQFDAQNVHSGSYSLKVSNATAKSANVYYRMNQRVACKPGTTYNFGTYAKVQNMSTNGLAVVLRGNDWSDYIDLSDAKDEWTLYQSSFTTAADQTSLNFNFVVEGEAVCWFDDMFVCENGTSDNILKNGDLEGTNTFIPFEAENHSTSYSAAYTNDGTDTVLKIVNSTEIPDGGNVYVRFKQIVPVEPNTTYEFGGSAKAVQTGAVVPNVKFFGNDWSWNNQAVIELGRDWGTYTGTYTTGAEETEIVFNFSVEGAMDLWLDDLFVRKSGTTENLVFNGDFEGKDTLSRLEPVIRGLEKGEKNNVGINLLLSPHYFPANIADVDYYSSADGFIKYNINAPAAKKVVENHIRTIIPLVKNYPALISIILSNEAEFRTSNYSDFYYDDFIAYLKSLHGTDISSLNTDYNLSKGIFGFGKKTYDAWSDVAMPDPENSKYDSNAIMYDWIEFNDKIVADWHKWMADIIKEYTTIPLSSKVMNVIRRDGEQSTFEELTRGTDIELLDAASDFGGNDVIDYFDDPYAYWHAMMFYDYQYSVTDKPIYNSETHIIRDGNNSTVTPYDKKAASNVTNHLWMSASRGVSMHSIWLWAHNNNPASASSQSILTRPDAVAAAGYTGLDLNRLADSVAKIKNEQPSVAMFYSKPSRVHNEYHMLSTILAYQALTNAGMRVGFVSEKSLDKLGEYDALVLAGVTNATDDAAAAVTAFMTNGGKVLTIGDAMTKNEYDVSRSNSIASNNNCTKLDITLNLLTDRNYNLTSANAKSIISAVEDLISANNLTRVELKNSDGSTPTMLDWFYTADKYGNLLINISNVDYDNYGTAKTVNVYFDGEKVTGLTDLISGTTYADSVTLNSFKPQLLSTPVEIPKAEIQNPYVDTDNNRLVWTVTDGEYAGAEVYKKTEASYELVTTVFGDNYEYTGPGIYVVKLAGDETECADLTQLIALDRAITASLANITVSESSVSCDVSAENISDYAFNAKIKVELLNADGTASGRYHSQIKKIDSNKDIAFKISLPKYTETAVKVTVIDMDTGKEIAASISKEF
ncbi:MAG: carbohydrate binding domain-containing protein [Clostridia bacterium]|nr:carbohydrate binding domain-containing protein [Clostridia bacterium]